MSFRHRFHSFWLQISDCLPSFESLGAPIAQQTGSAASPTVAISELVSTFPSEDALCFQLKKIARVAVRPIFIVQHCHVKNPL